MTPERWTRVQQLFDGATAIDPGARAAWIDAQCGEETELRDEVMSLLASSRSAENVLDIFERPRPLMKPHVGANAGVALGDTVGGYRIERELGRGGMGVVYLARDSKLERLVALKFLPPELYRDAEAKRRLVAEARAAAALDHPNIATVYEIDESADGALYISMAFYEGLTLAEQLKTGALPHEVAVDYACQIARGLQKAHDQGIIHRDVKPANLIVTGDGVVKILDFGVARAGDGESMRTGAMLGTVAYASPEQIRGETVDHRTDIWSFGVVLYELLTGKRPFRGEYEASILFSILNEDPASLPYPELEELVLRCLSKDPDSRPAGMREVLSMLSANSKLSDQHTAVKPESGASPPGNVPAPLSAFIGREQELSEVTALIDQTRLLTLTGTGGTGKTRLCIHLAGEVRRRFPDGIWFVPLAPVTDAAAVPAAMARALEVREQGAIDVFESLKAFLRGRTALVLLDNFEHILEAGPRVAALLEACPRLRVVVTSRSPLHVRGEHIFPVPPLDIPGDRITAPEELARCEAVKLFVQSARSVDPDFELSTENGPDVAAICKALDGLPLAIELAAARTRVLEPSEIANRLDHRLRLLAGGARDLPTRHQTLRESIGWSYGLLSREHQRLFRRLAVFAGGWTMAAAEKICAAFPDADVDVLESTAALIDNSLIQKEPGPDGQTRFVMLQTVREFAAECLAGAGEDESATRAHARIYTEYAESAEAWLTGPQQALWLTRLDQEYDNLRAVLLWSRSAAGDPELGFRIGAALWRFWLIRGRLTEGREWLNRLADDPGVAQHPKLYARLLAGAGTFAHNQGDYTAARATYEAALAQYRGLADDRGSAHVLNHMGWVAWRQGDFESARRLSEEGLALQRQIGDARGMAMALNNLAWVSHFQGDLNAAEDLHRQCESLQQKAGDRRGIAFARNNLGWVLCESGKLDDGLALLTDAVQHFDAIGDKQLRGFGTALIGSAAHRSGDLAKARRCIEEVGLPLFREIGDAWGLALALADLAVVLLDSGEIEQARVRCEESLALRRKSDDRWGVARSLYVLAEISRRSAGPHASVPLYAESLRVNRTLRDHIGLAMTAEGLAAVASEIGRSESAARLLNDAAALRRSAGSAPPLGRAAEIERISNTVLSPFPDRIFPSADYTPVTFDGAFSFALSVAESL